MSGVVEKVVKLRQVEWMSGNRRAFVPQPLHQLIDHIRAQAPQARDRHYPALDDINETKPPNLCSVIDNFTAGAIVPHGIGFRLVTYRPREWPEQMPPNFDGQDVEVVRQEIRDGNGKKLQLVGTCHAIAFGNVVLVESSRGAGGIAALERCLSGLIRTHCRYQIDNDEERRFPGIRLVDAADFGLLEALERNGGAARVVLKLAKAREDPASRFSRQATEVKNEIANTSLLTICHEAGPTDALSKDDVLEAFAAREGDEIDDIMIEFKRGGKAYTEKDFKVQRTLQFADAGGGHVNPQELLAAMSGYLLELMDVNKPNPMISEDGNLLKREG